MSAPSILHAVPARILVIDDEPDLRTLYELSLLREGHEVLTAGTLGEARSILAQATFDLVITDMRLPDGLGLELLRELAAAQRRERCIMITAYGSAENAVDALKAGAFDYMTKPVDLRQFRSVVASALEGALAPVAINKARNTQQATLDTHSAAATSPDLASDALQRLIGQSDVMCQVRQRIAKVATSMAPVLVHGESGTGKELVARAIHACSHRADGPLVAVNCGAIPEALLEAEFFGSRKGSYTGAAQDRAGFFQAACGGTLFLDEIGELPLAMQAKLLRAIQERRVRALGDTKEEPVDVRIVSATHRNLAAEVAAGRFRQDLYYRLNVIEIMVPPLRERYADLPELATALLARIARETGVNPPPLTPATLAELERHAFPGNVRELENLLHRMLALGPDATLDSSVAAPRQGQAAVTQPPSSARPNQAPPPANQPLCDDDALPGDLQAWLDLQERAVLVRALHQSGFNRTAAAAKLGLNLRQMRYRMARLGITAPEPPEDPRAT